MKTKAVNNEPMKTKAVDNGATVSNFRVSTRRYAPQTDYFVELLVTPEVYEFMHDNSARKIKLTVEPVLTQRERREAALREAGYHAPHARSILDTIEKADREGGT